MYGLPGKYKKTAGNIKEKDYLDGLVKVEDNLRGVTTQEHSLGIWGTFFYFEYKTLIYSHYFSSRFKLGLCSIN